MISMRRNESGFSLPELLTALIVIGVVTTSVIAMFSGIQSIQVSNNYQKAATLAAQKQIESLRNNNYTDLTDGQTINFTSSLPSILPPSKSGTATISEPYSGIKRVDVIVSYSHGGDTKEIKLSSLIGELGITQ